MKISHCLSALLLLTIPVSEKLMASEIAVAVCPMVGEHRIKFPDRFIQSENSQAASIGAITCGSALNSIEVQARLPYVEQIEGTGGAIEKRHEFLITLKPLSQDANLPIKKTLKSIYDPKNYTSAKNTPFPKVIDENGLTYVRGRQVDGNSERVDFYLKPDKQGNTDMAIYCYSFDGISDARNCLMGYTDKQFSLDVVVKINQSEIGDYKNIQKSVSRIIDSIIERGAHTKKNVIFHESRAKLGA